jgi:predicted Rossmann fold nucleotide-binding protein DprA/Smf involved in DNA uptake
MAWVSMTQAASCLGVSVDTIRRRLHRGELQGKQKPISQGFAWLIEIPDEVIEECRRKDSSQPAARLEATESQGRTQADTTPDTTQQQGQSEGSSHLVAILAAENTLLRELVETHRGQVQVLQGELEAKRRDIQELHVLLQRSQDQRALLEPKNRRWWQFWG